MDKKKRLIQLTEGILLCCVIVVMTLLCIGIIKKEVKNTKGKLTETTGWYRIQDNKKVQVDLNQKIKTDTQGKLVLYNDTIAQKYKGYLMTTKAAKYSVRIYAGDQLIYQYSDSNFHRNDQMKSKLSCDARIPEYYFIWLFFTRQPSIFKQKPSQQESHTALPPKTKAV